MVFGKTHHERDSDDSSIDPRDAFEIDESFADPGDKADQKGGDDDDGFEDLDSDDSDDEED